MKDSAISGYFCCGLVLCLMGGAACSPTSRIHPNAPHPTAAAATVETSKVLGVEEPGAITVSSAIRRVTVYSDRALVAREAAIDVAATPTVYAFRQLPGWVDEASIRVATSAGRVIDVRVVRGYLARANEPRFLKAEAEARRHEARLAALDDEVKVLDAEAKQIEDIKAFSLDKLTKEIATGSPAPQLGSVGVGTYSAVVDFIASKMREIAKGRRQARAERETLVAAAAASQKQLEELRGLTQLEETKVFVTVQAPAPTRTELELTYMLPGATWESTHELRAADAEAGSVDLTSYAIVTQASGEDWDGAALTFSTQSSTAAARIPALEALTLGDTRGTTQTIETRSASFQRAETAFQGQNRLWNKHLQRSESAESFEQTYKTNFESLALTQSKTVRIFQSLQQRGTTAQFRALAATNVRADGRAVRVPIGHAALKSSRAIVAAPEQSLNAAQTLRMLNDSGQALLPGSVALFQAGAFLGVTNIDFVADGEQFALFSSVVDQLKLSRVLDKKRSALVRKQRTQMQLAFVVTVENLSSKVMSLELADRIPVSEDRDVVVSNVRISPDAKPDSKGILRLPLVLQPKEKRTLEIEYQLEYPPTLVLETRRGEADEPSVELETGRPRPASPSTGYDLRRDIKKLELSF